MNDSSIDDAYRLGYVAGKEKAHFELRNWDGSHGAGCGCEPCITAEAIKSALLAKFASDCRRIEQGGP